MGTDSLIRTGVVVMKRPVKFWQCAWVLALVVGAAQAVEPVTRTVTTPAPKTAGVGTAVLELVREVVAAVTPAQQAAQVKGSHTQTGSIAVKGSDGGKLHTLCADNDGRVLALTTGARTLAAKSTATAEVHVFSADGKPAGRWKVPFAAQAINVGPDGSVFVAGDGRIARFDRDGKATGQVELPHLKAMLADKAALRKDAEELARRSYESTRNIVASYKKMKEKLEATPEEKRTALQKRQLQQYTQILKMYENEDRKPNEKTIEQYVAMKANRVKTINAIALSERDVFVVCGEAKGYGYAVWRMSHDFKDPVQVMTGLSGCCGQMDVQCCGGDLVVAENTRHRFARYDRDGKAKGAWGKRAGGADADGFGGCCNPMNVRVCGGDIYTAESEGLIKRFTGQGEFVGVVGYAPLTGGCKNVAVALSPDGARVYFADQPGSRIIVLNRKSATDK